MDRTHAGLLILALVAFGLAAELAYENVPYYVRVDRLDNVTAGNYTFHFVRKCEVLISVLEQYGPGVLSCDAWTLPDQSDVWIVTNLSLASVFEMCNHELYHLSQNTTTPAEVIRDHDYLKAHAPTWPFPETRFNECDQLMARLLLPREVS